VNSSDDALRFFKEWMSSKTMLSVTAVLSGTVVSGMGIITSLDDNLYIICPPFSMLIPLDGCSFKASDPEQGSGFPALDQAVREFGFKFGWEIVLPTKDKILLAEIDSVLPS